MLARFPTPGGFYELFRADFVIVAKTVRVKSRVRLSRSLGPRADCHLVHMFPIRQSVALGPSSATLPSCVVICRRLAPMVTAFFLRMKKETPTVTLLFNNILYHIQVQASNNKYSYYYYPYILTRLNVRKMSQSTFLHFYVNRIACAGRA